MINQNAKFHSNAILAANCVESPEGYIGLITVKDFTVKFSIKNVVTSLAEGDITISIDPYNGIESRPFNFHLKAYSDSNKEALARQLKLAFADYGTNWTLPVNEIVTSFISALTNRKQLLKVSEIEGEQKGWLFEPFIEQHSINIFFGMGSGGKTLTSLFVGLLYSQGLQLFSNNIAKKGKVLLVDFENDGVEWRDTIKGLAGKYNIDADELDNNFFYWKTEQIPLYNQVEKIKTAIRENNISLVIIDSASMAAGDSTSDEASALRLMAALKMLDITVLLIAHQRKNEGEDTPIGSIQYFNQARNMWHIEGIPDETDERILHIGCQHKKHNSGRKWKNPIGLKVFFGEGYIDMHLENAIVNFEEKFHTSDRIVALLKTGALTGKQIAESIDKKENTIRGVLKRLKDRGKLNNFNGVWSVNMQGVTPPPVTQSVTD